jgi:hypothetical protein
LWLRGNKKSNGGIKIALQLVAVLRCPARREMRQCDRMRQDHMHRVYAVAKIYMHGDLEGFRSSWSVGPCLQSTWVQYICPGGPQGKCTCVVCLTWLWWPARFPFRFQPFPTAAPPRAPPPGPNGHLTSRSSTSSITSVHRPLERDPALSAGLCCSATACCTTVCC